MKQRYDAIVVLGGGRDNSGNLTTLSTQRLDRGSELFREGLAPKIFALGGQKSTYSSLAIAFDRTGADLRREYLEKSGVPIGNIVMVEYGKDTIDEAFASRKVAREMGMEHILVVTSDKHLERSLFIFKRIFGNKFDIDGVGVPCGDLLNREEEREYLDVVKQFFVKLPNDIPNSDSEKWYLEHADLYQKYKEIHDRFHNSDNESQAYSGVRKEISK